MADAELWRRIERYAAADDPLTGASNRLALIVASNQPFYPLYVWWATGAAHPQPQGDARSGLTLKQAVESRQPLFLRDSLQVF